jgi:transcriptional regulator with XRE-family HTH domain
MTFQERPTIPGREFKRLREHLRLSRDEFAIELGLEGSRRNNATSIKRWEDDIRPVPLRAARLAWMFVQYGIPDTWPPGLEAQIDEDTDA